MTRPASAYMICSTPRTGSTLLCSLLKSAGCAGVPESYFRAQDIPSRAQLWNLIRADGSIDFRDYLGGVLEQGTGPNGRFGVRVMWGTLTELLNQLRSLGMSGADCEVLDSAFGPTRFIHIFRRDKLAQAISRLRAEQTDVWHVTESADPEAHCALARYDQKQIAQFIDEAHRHNLAWRSWFSENSVSPLQIAYEDLDRAALPVVRSALTYLGEPAETAAVFSPNVRMADELSVAWAERFRKETGYSG